MSYGVLGFIILLVLICVGYTFLHPHIKGFMRKGYFGTAISIPGFAYCLFQYMYYCGIIGPVNDESNIGQHYLIYGDATITGFCGFMILFLPLVIIFNPSKRIAKFMFPVGFVAGIIVLSTFLPDHKFANFVDCTYRGYGSVLKHFLLSIICFIGMFNTSKFSAKNKDAYWYVGIWGGYFVYVAIMSNVSVAIGFTPDYAKYTNCSGMYPSDGSDHGQYAALDFLYKYYPLPLIILILGFGTLFVVGGYGTNALKKTKKYEYTEPDHGYLRSAKQPRKGGQG